MLEQVEKFFDKLIEILKSKEETDANFLSREIPLKKAPGNTTIDAILRHSICQYIALELKSQGILTELEYNELRKLFPA